MSIPYRTRCALKRMGTGLLIFLAISALLIVFFLVWLDRFVVYTRDEGVVLDFDRPVTQLSGTVVSKPIVENPVSIYYNEGDNLVNTSTELTRISGYYITGADLEKDMEDVLNQVRQLPKGAAVMVDVKSIYGNFFYSSAISDKRNGDLDTAQMDEFIQELNKLGLYTIARLPALRDYHYGLSHVTDGLPTAGGYLWMDNYGCYWLNPASDGTQAYLTQIALELRGLGFNEVLFYDFYFPDSGGKVVFRGDQTEALVSAATTLIKTCATDTFAVSFTQAASFPLPEGRARLYLENVSAIQAANVAQQTGFENPEVKAVFITQVHDTRFDDYSVLRPISMVY